MTLTPTPLTSDIQVNTTTANLQRCAIGTALHDGGFLVTWSSFGQDGSGYGVYAQRYNAAGATIGVEFRANTTTASSQIYSSVSALDDGGFLITWTSTGQDGSAWGVYGQRYDWQGQAVGGEFRLNAATAGDQLSDSFYGSETLATLADGRIVSVWNGNDAGEEVFVRIFDLPAIASPYDDDFAGTGGHNSVDLLAGNDIYDGGFGNDSILGGLGNDTLRGGGGNDTIDGGAGNDSMLGGAGNDVYTANSTGDVIIENPGEGLDRVNTNINFTLAFGQELEELVSVTGTGRVLTGNTLANRIIGNTGNDTLNGGGGNDTLDGRGGIDSMTGGDAIDWYYVDHVSDVVIESTLAGGGSNDRVNTSVNWTLGAGQQVEELVVTVATGLAVTGNELDNRFFGAAGSDTLTGGLGNDTIYGQGGIDSMVGGAGNDIYFVDNVNDLAIEAAGQGTFDRIYTSVSYTIAGGNEIDDMLVLAGSGSLALTGNEFTNRLYGDAGNDTLTGNGGNDYIDGRGGNDILNGGTGIDTVVGGAGNDIFVLTPLQSDRDIFPDFNFNFDRFQVSNAAFGGGLDLDSNGVLDANRFVANATGTATSANQRFIYDTTQRLLIYDSNGSTAGGVQVVVVTNASTLSAANFNVVA